MKKYTVVYLVSKRSPGSARLTMSFMSYIEGESYEDALHKSEIDPSNVVFAFHGHCNQVNEGE